MSAQRHTPAHRAVSLVELIYAAATEERPWSDFLEALATDLGDAAIAMSLMFPGWEQPPEYYRVNLSSRYVPIFEHHFRRGLPWGPMTDAVFREGFGRGSRLFPDASLPETDFFRDYMEPQGLAPEGPISHLIHAADGRPVAGLGIHRRLEGRTIDDEDIAMCNQLIPHLRVARSLHDQRLGSRDERRARHVILDRLPTALFILDSNGRCLATNRAADRVLDDNDGFAIAEGALLVGRRDRTRLATALEKLSADDFDPRAGLQYLSISRPSGKAGYTTALVKISPGVLGNPVAAMFCTDPAAGEASHVDTFRKLYGLTHAEAELMSMRAEGLVLEEISARRGVTLATTRTQLKSVFEKTKTRRQAELVQLALSGIARMADE